MATTQVSIELPEALFEQAQRLAQQLNLSESQLFTLAMESFISSFDQQLGDQRNERNNANASTAPHRVINQGDIYWVELEPAQIGGVHSATAHPYVVIQDNLFNHSRVHSVIACALTSNIRRISETPGNVLLEAGEANLPKKSVVEVSKVSAIDKRRLGEYIGTLSAQRVNEILTGMRFLHTSFINR